MIEPDRSPERDAAIEAALPIADAEGWARAAALPDNRLLFPGGAPDLVEAFIDLADRRMVAHAAADLPALRLTARVRRLVAARLEWAAPHRAAVRRAGWLLARPENALLSARCTARTVDTIWRAAGDRSADFSWYTKRGILAGVYAATLLYWLAGTGDLAPTLAFLDRRLADIGRIGKLRARLAGT